MIYLKPQQREIRRGMRGRDVSATKRALKRAGFGVGIVLTNRAGAAWQLQLKRFQRKHGLEVTGKYGSKTHAVLKVYMAQVPYAVWLWNNYTAPKVPINPRHAIVSAALFAAHREWAMYYTQGPLRMWGIRNRVRPPSVPKYEDCSSFVTWLYWLAGCADPNGLGYNGQGYTGTLSVHGRKIMESQLRPGDLVFYGGWWPFTHVAVYIGGGMVVSHGGSSGPKVVPLHYRTPSAFRSYLP